MQYPDHLKEDIRSRIDIADFIARYLPLKKAGASFKALCPFHQEKTPSFTVTPAKGIFHCFGCGKGGDIFSFLMEIDNLGFGEAFKVLANEAGIDLTLYQKKSGPGGDLLDAVHGANQFALKYYAKSLKAHKQALDYLTKRGITADTIDLFGLGYAPSGWDNLLRAAGRNGITQKDLEKAGLLVTSTERGTIYDRFRERIIFPIYNVTGLAVGFSGRTMTSEKGAKYINSPETVVYKKGSTLHGLHITKSHIKKEKSVVLVEGQMDFLSLFQNGVQNTTACSGTALTKEQARILRRYCDKVILMFDSDLAGSKAAERGVEILLGEGLEVAVVSLPGKSDPDSFIKEKGVNALRDQLAGAKSFLDFKVELLRRKHPGRSPESKGRIVGELALTLAAIKDEVVQEAYIKALSERLSISETRIARAVGLAAGSGSYKEYARAAGKAEMPSAGGYKLEEEILRQLVLNPSLAKYADDLNDVDVWQHKAIKAFFNKIVGLVAKEGDGLDLSEKISSFSAKERQFVAKVLSVKMTLETGQDQRNDDSRAFFLSLMSRMIAKSYDRKLRVIREKLGREEGKKVELLQAANEITQKKASLKSRLPADS